MARKVHLDTAYIFVPASNRITIDKAIPQEKLLLITNLSTNTVVYNFSDPNLKVNSYVRTRDTMIAVTGNPGQNQVTNLWPTVTPVVGQRIAGYGIPQNTYVSAVSGTTLTLTKSDGSAANLTADPYINQHTPATLFGTVITLAYNTSGMNAADKLQIFVDEYEETTRPAEVYTDPVSKQRMSTPQALIDTDFELGLQPTKWESLQLISNRPSFFYNVTTPITLNTVTTSNGSRTVAVDTKAALTGLVTTSNASVNVTGTNTRFLSELLPGSVLYNAAGTFIGYVSAVASDTTATLKANGASTETNISAFATGQRYQNNGAPGTGIFSGAGTLTNTLGTTGVTGTSTRFLTEVRPGDWIFNQAGATVGQVSTIASDTSLTLTANSTAGATAAYGVSQYAPSSTVAGAGFSANPIFVTLTSNSSANGSFLITGPTAPGTIGASTTFNYEMDSAATSTGSILDAPVTYMYPGQFYNNQQLGATNGVNFATDATATNSTITVTLQGSCVHGLSVGSPIFVAGTSSAAANGNFYVATIISPTAFTYVTQATVATITAAQGRVYVRPVGITTHRPTDGGIKISAGVNAPGHQMIRQSRRYFRYQSGKGIQYSTGTVLQPSIFVNTITSASSIITVNCRESHFLYPGAVVSIQGATNTGAGSFNGLWTVLAQGLTDTVFQVTTNVIGSTTYTAPSTNQTAGGFPINVSVRSWTAAQTRLGLFDNQNGMFFKFDGTTLYTCRRSSTDVLAGRVTVNTGSSTVTGINTLFSAQLKPGNNVVIRGQTYTVGTVVNDTSMTIIPEYRGASNITGSGAWIMKTIDLEIPQSDWNIDRCDGTGPSGYSLDLQRMQMYYIDYSWYGAGAVRYGFKDQKGEVIYVNRIAHANTKTEAYMRSGNLPARYETNTLTPSTILQATLSSATTAGGTISVQDVSQWPNTGFAVIQGSSGTGELIEYSAKSTSSSPHTLTIASRTLAGGTFANCTTTSGSNTVTNASTFATTVQRFMHVHGPGIPIGTYVVGVSGTTVFLSNPANATSSTASLVFKPHTQTSAAAAGAAQTFTYSATNPISVAFYNPQFAPNISHWGSSVIMDGRYDDDKSLIFTAGMPSAISVPGAAVANVAGQPVALLSIRVAPAVDAGLGDLLGRKEIINRMQLALASCGVTTDRRLLVDVRLNGQLSAGSWQSLGGSSLSQVCYHTANTTISGGESVFSFYTSAGGGGTFSVSSFDLSKARDLGNSILGGGTSLNASTTYYPDGPDILTLVVRNLETTAGNTLCRVSWTEAQA